MRKSCTPPAASRQLYAPRGPSRRAGHPDQPRVDRPMRPLFPKEMRNDVCITMTVMSLDPDCSPEIAGMIGASLVTAVSEIPWNGPIGGVQVGLVDGEIVINPTYEQRRVSDLALTVAGTMDKDRHDRGRRQRGGRGHHAPGHQDAPCGDQEGHRLHQQYRGRAGQAKVEFQTAGIDMDIFHAVRDKYLDRFKAAMDTDDKNVRDAALLPILNDIAGEYPRPVRRRPGPDQLQDAKADRPALAAGRGQACGRPRHQRDPSPGRRSGHPARVHGSGMFTPRADPGADHLHPGRHQGQPADGRLDRRADQAVYPPLQLPAVLGGRGPRARSPGRREIGHGALAERALVPVLPSMEDFPYTIRCVSEVLSSNAPPPRHPSAALPWP